MFKILLLTVALLCGTINSKAQEVSYPITSVVKISDLNEQGHGSGTQIKPGEILTAAHVARSIEGDPIVKDFMGVKYFAKVKWIDNQSDVAIVEVKNMPDMRITELDCSYSMKIGDKVTLVGNPLDLEFIYTFGYIAGEPRVLTNSPWSLPLIPLNILGEPGVSGGPVIHDNKVVGIAVGKNASVIAAVDNKTICKVIQEHNG